MPCIVSMKWELMKVISSLLLVQLLENEWHLLERALGFQVKKSNLPRCSEVKLLDAVKNSKQKRVRGYNKRGRCRDLKGRVSISWRAQCKE